MKTHDCEPTLTDSQVLQFCQDGYLILKGVVPDEINKKSLEFLQTHTEHTPTPMLDEDWFVDNDFNAFSFDAFHNILNRTRPKII